ncbi:hypothetical protein HVE01_17850 [Vreelandella venusta]|nr:hypothetical protein HVE01_17850 [Halomonas venusta]
MCRYGGPLGPPATLNCKPRQARKGATVVVAACAGMWLLGLPPFLVLLLPETTDIDYFLVTLL